MLSEKSINDKIKVIDEDIEKVVQNISSIDKQRTDLVATLHALQGAKQQCQSFLQEIDNDDAPQPKATGGRKK